MPRTVIRQFTGGVSNELDPQNLRDDQGETALDINLKGFALEPGDGTAPLAVAGHYFYRGEWIRDSEAVSFEESGIGVVKTFDNKRPQFEEIIKDDVNISRDLGPSLPPSTAISGIIASEGTRGERPGDGAHLIKVPGNSLGTVDEAKDGLPAPSLKTVHADATSILDDIYYYNGQPYWIVKSGNNWTVRTKNKTTVNGITVWLNTYVNSGTLTHTSGGSFFKENYFICWDGQYIQSVLLLPSALVTDTVDTVSVSDAGTGAAGGSLQSSLNSGATGDEITGVDIANGVISFSQKITTGNTTPTAFSSSVNERWLRMPSDNTNKQGCFVLFLRDGMPNGSSESNGTGNYAEVDNELKVYTDKSIDVFPGWESPTGILNYGNTTDPDRVSVQNELNNLGDIDFGLKYAVVFAKNDTWVRVLYVGIKKPEIIIIKKALANNPDNLTGEQAAKEVVDSRTLTSASTLTNNVVKFAISADYGKPETAATRYFGHAVKHYKDTITIKLNFTTVSKEIEWTYLAPVGSDNTVGYDDGYRTPSQVFQTYPNTNCSSYSRYQFNHAPTNYFDNRLTQNRKFFWIVNQAQISTNGSHTIFGQAGSWKRTTHEHRSIPLTEDGFTNNLTAPSVPGKLNRLSSYTPGGSAVQQDGFSISKLWTAAKFTTSNTLEFSAATTKNFRIGDWIKIGQNGTNKSMHLNLRGVAKDIDGGTTEQTFITAKILGITNGVSLKLSPPEIDSLKTGKYIEEECYPLITGFIEYDSEKKETTNTSGPTCKLIKSDMTAHVLIGHGNGREFLGQKNEVIELRDNTSSALTGTQISNNTHTINWSNADVRAVNQTTLSGQPRIFYKVGSTLYSKNGVEATGVFKSVQLAAAGSYSVDSDYLTHIDSKKVTIYSPNLDQKFLHSKPELPNGLGITGDVSDAKTIVVSNVVYVFIKIGSYWKLIKTGSNYPESALLTYNFKKPLGHDGTNVWGIGSDTTNGWDIQTATPFYESDLIGGWVFYANNHNSVAPSKSAWGQVVGSRLGTEDDNGIPRYLSIDWKMDSGIWFNTGTATIGLNDETTKLTGTNTFKWYPLDKPSTLTTSNVGTVISNITGNTYTPVAQLEIQFESKILRDVVFFKASESLPAGGATGAENQIFFINYKDANQSFYIINDKAFGLIKLKNKEEERAYRLTQSNISGVKFDASKVGISTFLLGAPNMYNPYGPNIDFYYRASFIDTWGNESAPSPLSVKGIGPLDSPDDCIQINFDIPFFDLLDSTTQTIRLYRYGGDSSEFQFLSDIKMPNLVVGSDGIKTFPILTGFNGVSGVKGGGNISRKSSLSPYYLFKTYYNISSLKDFINSPFDFTSTSTASQAISLDGSWRINQLSESIPEPAPSSIASGIGASLVGGSTSSWALNSTDVQTPMGDASGTAPAVGQLITHPHFPTGTKIASVTSEDFFNTDTAATSSGNPTANGALERGRAFSIAQLLTGETVDSVTIGGVATTAYSISGSTITFTTAPAVGTNNISVLTTYSSLLTENLNIIGTTVKLSNATLWPASGVVKLGTEYISYTAISGNNLTGCVRGVNGSSASDHESSVSANLVLWEMEMEHRNQDTTTLEVGISTALTNSSGATLTVESTSVFPDGSSTTKILIGNEVFTYTGKTATTFTGVNNFSGFASVHAVGVVVRSYNETYVTTDLNNTIIEVDGYGYRDKARTPVSSLYYMQNDNWPPIGVEYNATKKQFFETESEDDYFRYIKAVGSMYFAALDANLKFSRYGTPEYWPLDAVLTLDSEIRSIQEYAGEGIVFTTNSVYRVRGTDPKAMVAFRVPDGKGIMPGYENTVSEFNGGLLWLTASDGIAMYQAGKVSYLTRDKHDIGTLVEPQACVADGVYWLFQKPGSGTGYRLELSSGEIRLAQTSIEAYYAYFAKALGIGVVVTKDNIVNTDDTTFVVEEIGGETIKNISWKSKKFDTGEPAIPKALGSVAIVYEVFNSKNSTTIIDGIRGQALAANLLGLNPDDLDAGDLISASSETSSDLYDIFTKYNEPDQDFIIDIGGGNLTNLQRKTIIMPLEFEVSEVKVGDRIWGELLSDNTSVTSITTEAVGGVTYTAIVLDKEPLRSGTGILYWGNLPIVEVFLNEDDVASRIFTLPPGDAGDPQSMDLYLNDLKRFRTISIAIKGDVRVQALSLRHYPLQNYQSQSLHHSADVFYKGSIDFRIMLDGALIYRKELNNAGDDFKEERVYLPASSFGQRAHYMNESRTGMIESVKFNGTLAA
jgi:hypothetical protein